MYNLEEVFKNGPQDIQERMDVIANTIDGIMRLQSEVQAQGLWCPKCQRWYYKVDCGLVEEVETKLVCTNPFNGYLDDYEYEERTDIEFWETCPNDHKLAEKPKFIL